MRVYQADWLVVPMLAQLSCPMTRDQKMRDTRQPCPPVFALAEQGVAQRREKPRSKQKRRQHQRQREIELWQRVDQVRVAIELGDVFGCEEVLVRPAQRVQHEGNSLALHDLELGGHPSVADAIGGDVVDHLAMPSD